jgi:predicted chitinase
MHETDRKFLPIEEYGKGKNYDYGEEIEVVDQAGKKYKNVYYGRGYVQLTWEKNYKTIGKALGMGEELHVHPEKVLEPAVAYKIMSYGMRNGTFTGKKLSNYISGTTADYYNARRIINGVDKAQLIQGYAETLEQLLRLSQNQLKETRSIVECTPTANICIA